MSGMGLVLVVAALVVVGVTLMVVGRRRERRGLPGDLRTGRDDLTPKGKDAIQRPGEDSGHLFSTGWGGGFGGGGGGGGNN